MPWITRNVDVRTDVDVDIEIDADTFVEVFNGMDEDDQQSVLHELGAEFVAEGSSERKRNLCQFAYDAVKRMGPVPREVSDFFWEVHGIAI